MDFKKLVLLFLVFPLCFVYANEEDSLYDSLERDLDKKVGTTQVKKRTNYKDEVKKFKKISDLSELAPFSDIAVINKKYMPKTKRFELSLQGMVGLNNAFFNNLGVSAHLDWYLNESWGIELSYYHLIDSEREITKNLADERQIETRSFVLPLNYMGGALKWAPFYGKMALFEDRIVSFDWFITLGGGVTETQLEKEPTLHLGLGQYLALSKNMAFRWDINWHAYNATILRKNQPSGSFIEDEELHNDLFLAIGLSFFFPGVDER